MKVLIVETAFVACLLGFGIRAQAQGAPAEHSMTGVEITGVAVPGIRAENCWAA
jgi:hypothetical protein